MRLLPLLLALTACEAEPVVSGSSDFDALANVGSVVITRGKQHWVAEAPSTYGRSPRAR